MHWKIPLAGEVEVNALISDNCSEAAIIIHTDGSVIHGECWSWAFTLTFHGRTVGEDKGTSGQLVSQWRSYTFYQTKKLEIKNNKMLEVLWMNDWNYNQKRSFLDEKGNCY